MCSAKTRHLVNGDQHLIAYLVAMDVVDGFEVIVRRSVVFARLIDGVERYTARG